MFAAVKNCGKLLNKDLILFFGEKIVKRITVFLLSFSILIIMSFGLFGCSNNVEEPDIRSSDYSYTSDQYSEDDWYQESETDLSEAIEPDNSQSVISSENENDEEDWGPYV